MRLGIHGWRLCAHRTGVPRYLRSLVREWDGTSSHRFSDITLYTPRPLDDDDEQAIAPAIHRAVLPSSARMLVWENLQLGLRASDDVLFCPSYSRPLVARGRTVVVTHDMIYCVQPRLFPAHSRGFYRALYGWSDRHATLVIAVAEAVKDEIVHYCGVPPERVRVTYLAPAPYFRPVEDAVAVAAARRRVIGADVPYFLFVGKTTGRRSLTTVIEGFARFCTSRHLSHRLLLVGRGTDSGVLRAHAARLGVADRVVHAGFLDDDTLNLLYNGATALVTGAVYETTSLPVMEAQAAGVPVICYGNPGMVEITDGAAMLLRSMDTASISDAMVDLAEDAALWRSLRDRGLASAARFSWARCARETMAILEEAATR